MFEMSGNTESAIKRFGAPEAALRLEYKTKGKVTKYYEECAVLADSLTMCKNITALLDGAPSTMNYKMLPQGASNQR